MKSISLIFLLAFFNIVVWSGIIGWDKNDAVYFLNVGQGDSELIFLKNGVTILVDGGPSKEVIYELEKILPSNRRYIDLVVLTHPDYDHYAGLINILDYYEFGVFLRGAAVNKSAAFKELENKLEEFRISSRMVSAGDRVSVGPAKIEFIHSLDAAETPGKGDDSLIMIFESSGAKVLFAADCEIATLSELAKGINLDADILKIPHHGSRFGINGSLLEEISPSIAVIEVGDNSYGHPAEAVVGALERNGVRYFRTDRDGTIKVSLSGDRMTAVKIK